MSHVLNAETRTERLELGLDVEVYVSWKADDDPDLSHLGKITDTEEPGAIDRKEHAKGYREGHTFRYFIPENHRVFKEENWSHVSQKEKDECIKKYGSLEKTEAHYAMEDFKRMEAYNNDEWHMTGCVVKVVYGPLEAKDSIWGIESDCGDKYRRETEKDCTSAAMSALEEKILARLKVE